MRRGSRWDGSQPGTAMVRVRAPGGQILPLWCIANDIAQLWRICAAVAMHHGASGVGMASR
jgi:hypothetical protein